MKIGINTYLFTPSFTTESLELLGAIHRIGFDSVEIGLPEPALLDPRKARAALEREDLKCCSICGAFGNGRDLRGTIDEQRNAKRYIIDTLRVCSALGAPILAGPVYSRTGRAGYEPEEARRRQFDLVVENLRELCAIAEQEGVRIAVEVMNRFATDFLNTVHDALRLISAVESRAIGLHLDTFHMNIEESNLAAAIRAAGRHLVHFHVADNHRGAPGTGALDWIAIRDALRSIDYNGHVVMETFMPATNMQGSAANIWRALSESPESMATHGLRFLEDLFAS